LPKYFTILILLVSLGCKNQKETIQENNHFELCLGCGYASSYSKDYFKLKMMYQNKDTLKLITYLNKSSEPNKFYSVYYIDKLITEKLFYGDSIIKKEISTYKSKTTSILLI
jgi:hypothetical protein